MTRATEKLENACRDFEEDLVLYYYGEGSDAERSRVEKHFHDCARCNRFLGDLRKLLPQMAQAPELPQSFWNDYYRETMAKLGAEQTWGAWWKELLAPARLWMLPAFGTAAVAVLAFGLVLGKGNWNFLSGRSQHSVPQEVWTDSKQLEFFESMDMLESLRLLEALDHTNAEWVGGQRS